MRVWHLSHSCDKQGRDIADRHYNRQKIGAKRFVPPGRCLVFVTELGDAVWVTSWPFAEYVRHAWAGAWVNSCFRNESPHLSSTMILQAVAATRNLWPDVPSLGMVTFIDPTKVRKKRDFGRCYLRAGFVKAKCPVHAEKAEDCAACDGKTEGGLIALQMTPDRMPAAEAPLYPNGGLYSGFSLEGVMA